MARKKVKNRNMRGGNSSNSSTNKTASSSHAPLPTPKQLKPRCQPGRIISLHNVPPLASIEDIAALLPGIPITEHKRSMNADTNQPSEIVFLLFPTNEDAISAFLALGEVMVLGQAVRANLVNGVKFERAEKKDGGNESGLDGGEDEARWQKRDSSDVPGSWPSDASN